MNTHFCSENDVVIAGTGIAAAAVAIQLLNHGFHPVLLSRKLPCIKGIEAIPESALRLFHALNLLQVLENAGSVWVEGFENAWQSSEAIIQSGKYIHVERVALLQTMIATAINRGAEIVPCNTIPPIRVENDFVYVSLDGIDRKFTAAIDATGRSAIWSRSTRWHHREIAEIYSAVCSTNLLRGRIVKISGGWAYRIGLPDRITVGVIKSRHLSRGQIDTLIIEKLRLEKVQLCLLGRRPAFPQWAEEPIKNLRISIGDAALTSNPIAGQGIRFALSSAIACAAVVNTWRDSPADRNIATEFYREFVDNERQKHLSSINSLYANEPISTSIQTSRFVFTRTTLPSIICLTGLTKTTSLNVNGLVQLSEVFVLADGQAVRWLGEFDLLTLKELGREPLSSSTLVSYLASMHINQEHALSLIKWCLEHQILSSIPFQVLGQN